MTKRSGVGRDEPAGDDAPAILARAMAAHQAGDLAAAETLYKRVLRMEPRHFDALHWLGVAAAQRGRHDVAIGLLRRALAVKPRAPRAHCHLGLALAALQRFEDALRSFEDALAIAPDFVEALLNRGITLGDLQRHAEAIASFDAALAVAPDNEVALFNRGIAFTHVERHAEALASFDRALAIKPDFAAAWFTRGNALADARRPAEALASYDRAVAILPDFAAALFARGEMLQSLGRHEEAIGDFTGTLAAAPDHRYAQGYLHYARLNCCDWIAHDESVARLRADLRAHKGVLQPFSFLAISDSPSEQSLCAQLWLADKVPAAPAPLCRREAYRHQRIRLAYLSADFHEHAVAYLTAELFERHDRTRFELTALSFGPNAPSAMRTRLKDSFDSFVDARAMSDREAAHLLREREIDIAVDLNGFTAGCRTAVLTHRPAPIQVNYLGYPGTMGADFIDYLIADRFVIPPDQQRFYREKIVYLPDTYQANDSKRPIAEAPTRAAAGLPPSGFVFCSFNNSYKIAPAIFAIWMRLLRRVEGSVLWLLAGTEAAERNLRREAASHGVGPERLVFAPRIKLEDHLARHRLADLFLDTLPYGAHTTASDALWAGLPVLSSAGRSFAGRVAGSLLHAIGLPELVVASLDDYEGMAVELASDRPRLATLRARLADNRRRYPLFDSERFRRHIESAFETMWHRHEAGEKPTGFTVDDAGPSLGPHIPSGT